MTLPSHVTSRAPQPSIVPAEVEPRQTAMEKAASILPESQREKLLQEERRKNQQAVSERKRPSRRRRPQQPDPFAKQIVLENVKKARKTNPFGLQSLLKVAQNGGRINLDPDRSKTHRTKRTVNERAIYEHVTVTKEMKEREERDRLAEEQRKEQEELQLDAEFKDMREREREERMQLATEWRLEDTVASGMRYAYRLAKIEHTLFGEGEDKKKRDTLVYLGLELKKLPDNDAVTTLMTIEFDENDI